MRAVQLVFAVVWAAFLLYWLVVTFSMKRGRIPWSRELAIRAVIVVVVVLLVRLGEAQTWRVARVDRFGSNEVEVVLVKADDSEQLVLNMHPGEILERLALGDRTAGNRVGQFRPLDRP